MRAYAGIGSRGTWPDVCALMEDVARYMASDGYVLRSGHAPGADQAFERGAGGAAEIYLPWQGFEAHVPTLGTEYLQPAPEAYQMAAKLHDGWYYLNQGSRALMARNMHQVLGPTLDDPVEFVICWTPNGSRTGAEAYTGGTGQALRLAKKFNIKVFNLMNSDDLEVARVAAGMARIAASMGR